jgi:hypothetical protein
MERYERQRVLPGETQLPHVHLVDLCNKLALFQFPTKYSQHRSGPVYARQPHARFDEGQRHTPRSRHQFQYVASGLPGRIEKERDIETDADIVVV